MLFSIEFRALNIIPHFGQKRPFDKDSNQSQLNQLPVKNCDSQNTGESPCMAILNMSHIDVRVMCACKPWHVYIFLHVPYYEQFQCIYFSYNKPVILSKAHS